MNLKTFFSYQNLFQINTAYISPQEKMFLLAGGVAVLVAIVLKIAAVMAPNPVDKTFRNKLYRAFLFLGLGQMVWYFLRYENVKFFGSIFISLILCLIFIIWLVFIAGHFVKNYKSQKMEWEKNQQKAKYLPQ